MKYYQSIFVRCNAIFVTSKTCLICQNGVGGNLQVVEVLKFTNLKISII